MGSYRIADLTVNIDYHYDYTRKRSEEYLIADTEDCVAHIEATDEDFQNYSRIFHRSDCFDEFEYVIVGNKFNRLMLKYDGLVFHSSCVVVDDTAYLFSADSGTGKSTHTALWLKLFGDRAYILNDDKPILRTVNGETVAYGTPFSGKTDLNQNKRAKIGGICFLSRAENNSIKPITPKEAIPLFLKQTLNRFNDEELETLLSVMDKVLTGVKLYKLECNMDIEAARIAYTGMSGKEL